MPKWNRLHHLHGEVSWKLRRWLKWAAYGDWRMGLWSRFGKTYKWLPTPITHKVILPRFIPWTWSGIKDFIEAQFLPFETTVMHTEQPIKLNSLPRQIQKADFQLTVLTSLLNHMKTWRKDPVQVKFPASIVGRSGCSKDRIFSKWTWFPLWNYEKRQSNLYTLIIIYQINKQKKRVTINI